MDFNRLTQKSQEAFTEAQNKAVTQGHMEVDGEHLLWALLDQEDGLVGRLLARMDIRPEALKKLVQEDLERRPHVSGPGAEPGKIYVSQRLSRLLVAAESEAKRLKDEYVSVEHLLMALVAEGDKTPSGKILKQAGVDRERFLKTLTDVRGNQRVTSANPEASYEALEKYGRDLVKMARDGKLDPVIGRDEEVRRVIRVLSRKTKNNPVLIGEPGVGKTAIVEGPGPAHRARQDVPEGPQGQERLRPGHGLAHRRGQVPRRVRGAAQGRAQGGPAVRGPDHPVHRRAAHHRGRGQGRGRHGRRQPAQTHAGPRRAALHRGHDHRTSTASTSRRTRPWSAASSRCMVEEPTRGGTPSPSCAACASVSRSITACAIQRQCAGGRGRRTLGRSLHLRPLQLPDKAIDLIDEACGHDPHRDRLARPTSWTRPVPPDSSNWRSRSEALKRETDKASRKTAWSTLRSRAGRRLGSETPGRVAGAAGTREKSWPSRACSAASRSDIEQTRREVEDWPSASWTTTWSWPPSCATRKLPRPGDRSWRPPRRP